MENVSFYTILESDVILNKNISSTEKILYSIICLYSNNDKGYCYKSYKQLMEIINLKERQFYYCLENLKKIELITIEKSNNRTYLMPKINKIYLEAQQKRNKLLKEYEQSDIFGYDWLNEP